MNQRISIYTPPHFGMSSYFDVVDFAVELGISNVEIYNTFEFAEPDVAFAQELRRYADQRNVKFVCVSLGINLVENTRQKLELAKQYAQVAAVLGSPYFHHTIAWEIADPQKIHANYNQYYDTGIAAAQELYDYAKPLGVRTLVEDQGFLFNGVDNFARFRRDVDRDIGVVADLGNIMFVDEGIGPFIKAFSGSIVHVHVKDYISTSKASGLRPPESYVTWNGNYLQPCPLGCGSVNFDEAFALLRSVGYTGPVSLECPTVSPEEISVLHRNIQYLEKFL